MFILQPMESLAYLLVDMTVKGTLLLLAACVAVSLLRRSSAALRHSVWRLAMLSLLLLPIVAWALPEWRLPILPPAEREVAAVEAVPDIVEPSTRPAVIAAPTPIVEEPQPLEASEARMIEPVPLPESAEAPTLNTRTEVSQPTAREWTAIGLCSAWALGVLLWSGILLVGLKRAIRFRRQTVLIDDPMWLELASELQQRLQLQRPVELREHADAVMPMTVGIVRPVLLLPRQAHEWDESMRRAVLIHELAHVQRGDVASQLIGRISCLLYWFHPLAWYALRRLRQEREQACDDAVVQSGEKASNYAEQLLQVARMCGMPRELALGVAMADGNSLELRVNSLFDSARSHAPVRKVVALGLLLACGAALVTIAIVRPVAAGDSETVVSNSGAVAKPERSSRDPYVPKWRRGTEALQRIIDLKPVFGSELDGLKLGIAYATPQRVFAIGDRLPVELFLMNVSNREVTTKFRLNFLAYPPAVTDSQGKRMSVPRLITFIARPLHTVTLKPGEACCVPALGLGLGEVGPVSFVSPTDGKYQVSYSLAGLTSGSLEFKVTRQEAGDLRIDASYLSGIATPERLSIVKPVFGEAGRGIEMGLAFSTLRREFSIGDTIPIDLFFRNVGEREVTFGFHRDFYWSPLSVFNSRDEKIRIVPLTHWMFEPGLTLTLNPGEAYAVPTPGLRLSQGQQPLSLVAPDIGTYRIELSRRVASDLEKPNKWYEDLKTGSLELKVIEQEGGSSRIQLLAAGADEPEESRTEAADPPAPASNSTTPSAAKPAKRDDSTIPLNNVVWWEKVDGLKAGFLLDSPGLPNRRVPFDSIIKYRILLRNTTEDKIEFTARLVPLDYRETPYLIPSDSIVESFKSPKLPGEFRASGGRQGHKINPVYHMVLDPGEAAIIPAQWGRLDLGLYVGDGDGQGHPTMAKVRGGMNWIVQPLQIWSKSAPASGPRTELLGLAYSWTKVDRDGNLIRLGAVRTVAGKGGTILHPRIQLEVGTLNAAAVRNAKFATWGEVDLGLQCGIRLLNPRESYRVGDTLEAELLWRNTTDKLISTPLPRNIDLWPSIRDTEGRSRSIDFGAIIDLLPYSDKFEPGGVRSLGVVRITLVAEGTPSPKSNAEPGHVALEPGTYKLSGEGGVIVPGGGSPRSGEIAFLVAGREATRDDDLSEKRKAAKVRVEALGGEVRPYDETTVAVTLWKTKATDKDLAMIKCFNLVALGLQRTEVTDAGLAHIQDMKRLGDLDLCDTQISDAGLVHLKRLSALGSLSLIRTKVTDAGMKHLTPLKNLYMLILTQTAVTDKGLVHLGDFPKLRTLILGQTSITDEGLRHLRTLTSVNHIRLNGTGISDQGLEHLKQMSELRTVELSTTKIAGSGLRHLPPSVKSLWLPASQVDDDGLKHIGHLTKLETLILSSTKISDQGLMHLEKLNSLRKLHIENTGVTEAGLARLKSALPDCKVGS
jgi:beta-lactamase regulating signal transducer with metallopeptidase domain